MRELNEVVFVSAVRTPMGRFGGTLKNMKVYDLAEFPIREALRRARVEGDELDEAIIGCCRQAGNHVNPARTAALKGGARVRTPGLTLNKACPAGMKALILATQAIQVEQAEVVLAGGMESMSTIPHLLKGHRFDGLGLGPLTVEDGWSDAHDPIADLSMGLTAENLVEKYGLQRDELDRFAVASHQKAALAQERGWFDEEIAPVRVPQGRNHPELIFARDESIRYDASLAALARLRPAFKADGLISAGNACGLTDGAAFTLAMSREQAARRGLKPLFSVSGYASSAVDGRVMGEGPACSIPLALKHAGMTLADMDLVEINEAFAAQVLANQRALAIDGERLNVHGGAISLGHPTGCSGTRIVVTLYYALKRLNKEFGVAGICGGGGTTTAVVIRREN
jgi:acetyl-CoA C-acetyltransferase